MNAEQKRSFPWKPLVKALILGTIILILTVLFFNLVTCPGDYRCYQWVRGFYEEPEESLDAVFIGASSVYSSTNPMVIWQTEGLATWDYCTNQLPFELTEYVIREAVRRQPNAVYVVNLNTLDTEYNKQILHYLSDYMPFSRNKLDLIMYYLKLRKDYEQRAVQAGLKEKPANITWKNTAEYLVPGLLYHSRWDELNEKDFSYQLDGVKGASYYSTFLTSTVNITDMWRVTDETVDLPEHLVTAVDRLDKLVREENIKVMFTILPRAEENETILAEYNAIAELLRDKGYDVLDLREHVKDMNLDLSLDFYNEQHSNIHGAIKISSYVAEYLREHYGLEDKRGNDAYDAWNKAADKYFSAVAPYYLDIELNPSERDYTLKKPAITIPMQKKDKITFSWNKVKDAAGYRLYRKTLDELLPPEDFVSKDMGMTGTMTGWECLGDFDTDVLEYTDKELEDGKWYYYVMVPFSESDGIKKFGEFKRGDSCIRYSAAKAQK